MRSIVATSIDRALFALSFVLLLSLAWPGVEARADQPRDIAPSSRELIGLGKPQPPEPAAAPAAGCEVPDAQEVAVQEARQRELMRRLAQETGPGDLRPMNGRGVAYERQSDVALELARLRVEARQKAEQQ
jgi:hypothetical protein